MRGTGTLANPYTYSTTLVFYGFLLYQGAMHYKPGLVRTVSLLTFGLGAVGIFFSFSRGSWLGALIASIGLLVMYPKTTIRVMVLFLLIVSILGSGVLSKQIAFANQRLYTDTTAKDRGVIWDAGLQMIRSKPLFGWGYGNYSLYAGQFQRRVRNYVAANPHGSHNAYLTIAAELGLPALFLFAFPGLWWLMLTFKMRRRMPKEGFWSWSLLIVFWMVLLDHIIVTTFTDVRHSTYSQGMWWITLGLIANIVNFHLRPDDLEPPEWIRRAS